VTPQRPQRQFSPPDPNPLSGLLDPKPKIVCPKIRTDNDPTICMRNSLRQRDKRYERTPGTQCVQEVAVLQIILCKSPPWLRHMKHRLAVGYTAPNPVAVAKDLIRFQKQTNNECSNFGVAEIQEQEDVPQIPRKGRRKFPFLAGVVAFIALTAIGIKVRSSRTHSIQTHSDRAAEISVTVVRPGKASIRIPVLPGQTQAYTDAPIFAQTSGYLRKWYFDIGAKVKAGDVLAEIDTPEVDQELAQAQAQIKVAQAALNLAEVTYRRSQDLLNSKVIAEQDFDTAADTYRENQATVMADQANINQLEALEAFKIIRAPFTGIVTARNTDIGDFIAAGFGLSTFSDAADFSVAHLCQRASGLCRSG
jgi:biotin carboxyl carrier protein